MMDFSISDLLNSEQCYDYLINILHPNGLCCPNGHALKECFVYRRDRTPILNYRCKICKRCFNLFTDTVLQGTHYSVIQIVQLLQGIAQGTSTAQLAREMGVDRKWLLHRRHKLQKSAYEARCREPLHDKVTESDEMYQNSGEKRLFAS